MRQIYRILTALLLPVIWPVQVFAQPSVSGEWGQHMMGWGWGPIMFGGGMMFVFWGGIILLVILLVRWTGNSSQMRSSNTPPPVTPLDILKERFAKGEIDAKEYAEREKILSK